MTSQQHAKVLCISHLIYGTVAAIPLITWMALSGSIGMGGSGITLLFVGYPLSFLITAYGVLRDEAWAKVAAVISAALSIMAFPVGTALAAYTLWYFFGGGCQKLPS